LEELNLDNSSLVNNTWLRNSYIPMIYLGLLLLQQILKLSHCTIIIFYFCLPTWNQRCLIDAAQKEEKHLIMTNGYLQIDLWSVLCLRFFYGLP
jgi:hypothetical protein